MHTHTHTQVREGNDVKMAVEGAIPPLIALLSHPSTEVQLHACGAVRNLSVNDENKVKIARDVGLRCVCVCVYVCVCVVFSS